MRLSLFLVVLSLIGCTHRQETTRATLGGTVPITRAATPESFASAWDVTAGGAYETGVEHGTGGVTSGLANGSADASVGTRLDRRFGLRLGGEVELAPSTLRVGRGTFFPASVSGAGSFGAVGLAVDDPWIALQVGATVSVGAMPVQRQIDVTETSPNLCVFLCSNGSPSETTRSWTEQRTGSAAWGRFTAHALLTLHALAWLDVSAGLTLGNQPMVSGAAFVAVPSLALTFHTTEGTGVVLAIEEPVGTMPWIALPIATLSLRLGLGDTL